MGLNINNKIAYFIIIIFLNSFHVANLTNLFLILEIFNFSNFTKNFIINIQWNSRSFLEYRTESNRINPINPNNRSEFFNILLFLWVRFDRTEFIKIIQMHHVKSFKCNKIELGSIEPKFYLVSERIFTSKEN